MGTGVKIAVVGFAIIVLGLLFAMMPQSDTVWDTEQQCVNRDPITDVCTGWREVNVTRTRTVYPFTGFGWFLVLIGFIVLIAAGVVALLGRSSEQFKKGHTEGLGSGGQQPSASPASRFCPACGVRVQAAFCPKDGTETQPIR